MNKQCIFERMACFCLPAVIIGLAPNSCLAIEILWSSNFTALDSQVQSAALQAGTRISLVFSDDVNININFSMRDLGNGSVLGQARSFSQNYAYSSVRDALRADSPSQAQFLQGGNTFSYLSDSAGGVVSSSVVQVNNATAKALGLMANSSTIFDAEIEFNTGFAWDFDPFDGIGISSYSFVDVMMHEIGHAMGFRSSTDSLDSRGVRTTPTIMDLFRFSDLSIATGLSIGIDRLPDISADSRDKFFLNGPSDGKGGLSGGVKVNYSTGQNLGDGGQNSHWRDNLNLGLMDPTLSNGKTFGTFSGFDVAFFSAIGWDFQRIFDKLGNPSVPFPGPFEGEIIVCDQPAAEPTCALPAQISEPSDMALLVLSLACLVLFSKGCLRKPQQPPPRCY